MPDTATEEKKTDSEAPKAELAPSEAQPKPEEQKKEKADVADTADAAANRILQSEGGGEAVPTAKTADVAEPDAVDDGWKTLQDAAKRNGITPEQMVRYASAGYQVEQATQKPEPKAKAAAPEPEVDDDEVAPLSRKEFQTQMAEMKQQTAIAIAGAKNDSKLEALLNTQPLTRDEPEARATVARSTYELMAAGANMETAFGEASRRHANYIARVTKRSTTKKIAAQAALGEGGVGTSAPIDPPTFKPDADNIRSGATLKRALAYSNELHGSGN